VLVTSQLKSRMGKRCDRLGILVTNYGLGCETQYVQYCGLCVSVNVNVCYLFRLHSAQTTRTGLVQRYPKAHYLSCMYGADIMGPGGGVQSGCQDRNRSPLHLCE
jgi:hypothetical protein